MVHPLYLAFLASVGTFFWAVAAGSMVGTVAAYVSAGVALRTYEHQKPVLERPRLEIPFLLSVLTWPLRVPLAVYEYFWRLRLPRRFLVLGILFGEDDMWFTSWNQAVAFARKRAAESGEIVHITDRGRLRKSRREHRVFYAMYC